MASNSRSLKLSPDGKRQVEHALTDKAWSTEDLADKIGVGRATATKFRAGKQGVDRQNFVNFCKALGLDWATVAEPESPPAPNSGGAEPVEKARSAVAKKLHQVSNEAQEIYSLSYERKYDDLLQLHPDNLSKILDEGWQKSVRQCLISHGKGDDFLSVVKKVIDYSIANEELQNFSTWIQEKSSLKERQKSAAVRAFYLAMSSDLIGIIACLPHLEIMLGFAELRSQLHIDLSNQISRRENLFTSLHISSSTASPYGPEFLQAVMASNKLLSWQVTMRLFPVWEEKVSPFTSAFSSGLVRNIDNDFRDDLTHIMNDIRTILCTTIDRLNAWWSTHGDAWTEKLSNIITVYRDLAEELQCLNGEQQQTMRKYNDANVFLVELLKIENAASQEVRQEIEDNLLLPIAELKRRLPDQYGEIEEG
jgi:transcriptional regulator with XRE-family HTH domain